MQKFLRSTTASIMPIFAISVTTLVAIVAVALAIASDSKAVNEIQATADAAAVAGATAFVTLDTPKVETRLQAAHQEAENFAVANSDYTLVDLDIDAVSEDAYGQETQIHIEMEFQPANVMARVAGRSGTMAIRRRATAVAVWGFPLCTLALADDGSGVSLKDSAHYDAQNCIVWSNAESRSSMDFRSGSAKAQGFCAAGNVIGHARAHPTPEQNCDPIPDPLANWNPPAPGSCVEIPKTDELLESLDTSEKIARLGVLQNTLDVLSGGKANSAAVYPAMDMAPIKSALQDDTAIPTALAASIVNQLKAAEAAGDLTSVGGGNDKLGADGRYVGSDAVGYTPLEVATQIGLVDEADPADYADEPYVDQPSLTLSPNTYCGLDIHQGHVKLEPGVYHIKEAPLTVRRRATLTGEGVTIVMSGQEATFNIIDEARLTLTAPVGGGTAGFALVEDKKASFGGSDPARSRLAGDGIVEAIGTIYLPRHDFEISGNGSGQQASPLLQIVANTLQLSENGKLAIHFDPSQTEVPVGIKPARTARLVN